MFEFESEGPGSIPTRGNIFGFHVVKPLMPILPLLPMLCVFMNLCFPPSGSEFYKPMTGGLLVMDDSDIISLHMN